VASDPGFSVEKLFPAFSDKHDSSGVITGHYFRHGLLVAQKTYTRNPGKHVEIASRIDGFVTHVATFREIEVFNIRPVISKTTNIKFSKGDLNAEGLGLAKQFGAISRLHAIEHFGLGRHNDPIDALGHVKGLNNLTELLKKGGILYLSTPMGRQRVEFNAQRVFALSYLLKLFADKFSIADFAYADDSGDLQENVARTVEKMIGENVGCSYGCAIFELVKL